LSHSVRKVVKVGTSTAIVVPPHVLAHIGVKRGDFIVFDITMENFALVSRAPVPPYHEAAQKHEKSLNDTLVIPPPGGTSLDPRLREALDRAEDYHQSSDSLPDAGHDSDSPSESTSTKTDPTVQARADSVTVKDADRNAGAVDQGADDLGRSTQPPSLPRPPSSHSD